MGKIITALFNAHQLYQRRLLFWLAIKALVILFIILFAGIRLGPDEAQYWTWSRSLDFGYYSKPPGIAWQIWLGTRLFGHTELGMRFVAVLIAVFQALFIYKMALEAGLKPKSSFWCGLIMALCPLGLLGSFFSITDGGFLLCWSAACLNILHALNLKRAANSFKVGGWIALGALFKWPIYLIWFFYLCGRQWYFHEQKLKTIFWGMALSLVGLLPSLWWNISHDFATFRHVFATVTGGSMHQASGNLIAFLGSQVFLLSPILFVILLIASWKWLKQRESLNPVLFFSGFVTLFIFAIAFLLASFQKIQGNWVAFAYPTGILLIGWEAFEQSHGQSKWVKIALISSLLIAFAAISLSRAIPFNLNPLKHNLGWPELKEALTAQGYDSEKHFLVSDKYQTSSILGFYNQGQQRAYFLNLQGLRKNQFSYWPSLQLERQGEEGYLVWIENVPYLHRESNKKLHFYQSVLKDYFNEIEEPKFVPIFYQGDQLVKAAIIVHCKGCKKYMSQSQIALY